jgi:anti-sigma factor RsiW
MMCEEIRKLLDDFVDGTATAEDSAAFRAHTASCAACAAELAALKSLRNVTASLSREIEPEADLWSEIDSVLFAEVTWGTSETNRRRKYYQLTRADIKQRLARVFGGVIRRPKWNAAGLAWRLGVAAAVVLLVVEGVREWRGRGVAGGWDVTTIEGAPVVGARDVAGKATLREGEWLETDAESRARVDVANIGHVTVGPASAIRLKGSSEQEHRIELARGELSAFIWAPPRLFFVETPSGVAEDLGCQYHLAVDPNGNGTLEVTLGFVSFERDGREVIVPAGARCELRANVGPGTPHENNAGAELRAALDRMDFDGAVSEDVDAVLSAATEDDAVTLWHLIPRVEGEARARVVDRLASWVPLPEKATREGVIALDERMLERWWEALYPSWSHWN